MNLSDMVMSWARSPKLVGILTKPVVVTDEGTFEKGTKSDLLVLKDDGTYHFEVGDCAFSVAKDEIEVYERKN